MNAFDLTPLYRSSVGFDRLASMLDAAFRSEAHSAGYPPYNIEAVDETRYAITLAVAGFERQELELQVEGGVLTVSGKKAEEDKRAYLYRGIANRAFERKFNLAEHVEVSGAELANGLLTIRLVKEVPEAMKPRRINIDSGTDVLEHEGDCTEAISQSAAA